MGSGPNGSGKIVDLSVNMKPTAALAAMRLDSAKEHFDQSVRSHVAGGEVSMRICEAPGIPGKWLGAVVEQWPNGHIEILGALHADSATLAASAILPHFEEIVRSRKV
jgi:hypothetical protein